MLLRRKQSKPKMQLSPQHKRQLVQYKVCLNTRDNKENTSNIVGKTSALVDSGKHVLSSATPSSHPAPRVEEVVLAKAAPLSAVPVVTTTNVLHTDHISQEAYVTETSRQSPFAAQAAATEQAVAAAAATPTKSGPITTIRNFFKNLFGSSAPRQSQKPASSPQTAEATTATTTVTTTTVASSNPAAPPS